MKAIACCGLCRQAVARIGRTQNVVGAFEAHLQHDCPEPSKLLREFQAVRQARILAEQAATIRQAFTGDRTTPEARC